MSKGFINITTSGNGSLSYYLREGECVGYYHSGAAMSKEEILRSWEGIEHVEKLGDKSLGVRGRHDAQVRKNYVLSMPNELSPQVCIHRVRDMVNQTNIKDCTYTIVVHKGEKEGIQNQHVHLLVNERNVHTQKKDREMIKKEWLEKKFRPLYQQTFSEEFSKGKEYQPRERIEVGLYESDRAYSREVIKEVERVGKEATLNQSNEGLLEALRVLAQAYGKDQEKQEKEVLQQKQREQEQKQEHQVKRDKGFSMRF